MLYIFAPFRADYDGELPFGSLWGKWLHDLTTVAQSLTVESRSAFVSDVDSEAHREGTSSLARARQTLCRFAFRIEKTSTQIARWTAPVGGRISKDLHSGPKGVSWDDEKVSAEDVRVIYDCFRNQLAASDMARACDAYALERAAKALALAWKADRYLARQGEIVTVPILAGVCTDLQVTTHARYADTLPVSGWGTCVPRAQTIPDEVDARIGLACRWITRGSMVSRQKKWEEGPSLAGAPSSPQPAADS